MNKFDIIGDVHGCIDELKELLDKLGYFEKNGAFKNEDGRKAVFLGDLNDRGKSSISVIKTVISMYNADSCLYVYGNHCVKLYKYLTGRKVKVINGLETTVKEYELFNENEKLNFKTEYFDFFKKQHYYRILDNGKLVVSHAGIAAELIGKSEDSRKLQSFCIYGAVTGKTDDRGFPVRYDWAKDYKGSALNVYGHSPVEKPVFRNNTIDIDQGCVFGGYLTALRYPELDIVQVESSYPFVPDRIKNEI